MAPLVKHLEAGHVTTLYDLVELSSLDQHRFLLLLDLVDEDLLQIMWSDLLSALEGAVKLLALDVGFNGLLKVANCFIHVSC